MGNSIAVISGPSAKAGKLETDKGIGGGEGGLGFAGVIEPDGMVLSHRVRFLLIAAMTVPRNGHFGQTRYEWAARQTAHDRRAPATVTFPTGLQTLRHRREPFGFPR